MKNFPHPKRAPEGHVQVPETEATPEMLRAWGFPVKEATKSMGSEHVSQQGYEFWPHAVGKALAAGFLRLATPEEQKAHDEARLAKWRKGQEVDPEMLAWAWSVLRPEDRDRYIQQGAVKV